MLGRRPGARLGDPDRRRAGHRQVDAPAAVRGGAREGPARALRDRRGIRAPGRRARAPARRRGGQPRARRRDRGRAHPRARDRGGRARPRHRLDPDHVGRRTRGGARRRHAASRVHGEPRAARQDDRHLRAPDRPRHARGLDRGSARARAHGGHGALLRERFGQPLPRDPCGQEPLRRRQRDRRVRHGRTRPAGGAQPLRDLPLARQRGRCRARP